jgi:hypothetical protein
MIGFMPTPIDRHPVLMMRTYNFHQLKRPRKSALGRRRLMRSRSSILCGPGKKGPIFNFGKSLTTVSGLLAWSVIAGLVICGARRLAPQASPIYRPPEHLGNGISAKWCVREPRTNRELDYSGTNLIFTKCCRAGSTAVITGFNVPALPGGDSRNSRERGVFASSQVRDLPTPKFVFLRGN